MIEEPDGTSLMDVCQQRLVFHNRYYHWDQMGTPACWMFCWMWQASKLSASPVSMGNPKYLQFSRSVYIYIYEFIFFFMYKEFPHTHIYICINHQMVQAQPCSKPRTSIITVGCPEYWRCTYSNVHHGALGSKFNTQKEMNVTYPMPKIVLPAAWFLSGCMSKFETSDSSCSI